MDTFKAQAARIVNLSIHQKEIAIGSLLGDGYLVGTTRGYALRVNHGIQQRVYVDRKYKIFSNLTNSRPRISGNSYYFRTVTHDFFIKMRKLFYVGRKKRIPSLLEKMISPLVLAVWIMDDGSRDHNQLRINTQSFSKRENENLISILRTKFGITATINRDKNSYRLRIGAESMPHLKQIVARHFVPNMFYKLSL